MFQWFQRNLGIREQNACSATGTRGNCVQEWLPLQFLWKARDQARCILRRKDYNKPEFHWPYKFHCKKYQNINKHLIINFSLLKDQERQPALWPSLLKGTSILVPLKFFPLLSAEGKIKNKSALFVSKHFLRKSPFLQINAFFFQRTVRDSRNCARRSDTTETRVDIHQPLIHLRLFPNTEVTCP